ncbi:MAG: HEPN domain-containing protein [Anaerolineae bacterium]
MRKFDERVILRLQQLIKQGEDLLASKQPSGIGGWWIENTRLLSQWVTNCLNFLSRVLGDDSEHYRRFDEEKTEAILGDASPAERCLGVLIATREDIESGFLFERELLISADVFDDFLEQAEHLLENKYKDAAAVLIGSVLESSLRKMCVTHGIDVTDKTGIVITDTATLAPLNDALYKGKIYSKLVHKRITVWADLRNNAAHGHYDQYTQSDAEDMAKGVRSFVTEHLA